MTTYFYVCYDEDDRERDFDYENDARAVSRMSSDVRFLWRMTDGKKVYLIVDGQPCEPHWIEVVRVQHVVPAIVGNI